MDKSKRQIELPMILTSLAESRHKARRAGPHGNACHLAQALAFLFTPRAFCHDAGARGPATCGDVAIYIPTYLLGFFYLAQVPKVYGTYVHSDVSASTPVDHTQIDLYVLSVDVTSYSSTYLGVLSLGSSLPWVIDARSQPPPPGGGP